MAKRRDNAIMALVLVGAMTLIHFEMVQAATFIVGDAGGWTFGVTKWTQRKTFKAGNTHVFNYNPSMHNVVKVDKAGFDSCKAPAGAPVFEDRQGHDRARQRDKASSSAASLVIAKPK